MVAWVYLRVSTDAQDLERQEGVITAAKAAGYYVVGIRRRAGSGGTAALGVATGPQGLMRSIAR